MTRLRYPPRRSPVYEPGVEMPRPVIGLDIDGTMGEYHDHFLTFAQSWFGQDFRFDYDGSMPLYRWMGVSKRRYRECKMAYRRGGLKRSMPMIKDADWLASDVRKRGAVVIICTTRPFLMLENVDPDTREWLRRNRIQYDGILHGEHKYRDLGRQFGDRVIMVLEDLPPLIKQADASGLNPVLAVRKHNLEFAEGEWSDNPQRRTLYEALEFAHDRIDNHEGYWRQK